MSGEEDIVRAKKRRISLTLELIFMTVFSFVVGAIVWNTAENLGYELVLSYLDRSGYYEEQNQKMLQSLKDFIEENQVTEKNIDYLYAWVQQEPDVYAMFYKDIDILYSPYEMEGQEDMEYQFYELLLADGTPIKADLYCGLGDSIYYGIQISSLVLGGTAFVLLLFVLIHRKLTYIHRLEAELKILGSGNLNYPITIRGNDEITGLAEGIESMKRGILEEQKMKDEAEKANVELVTAMSHDLRTPLTSLIGYLELLHMHRYQDEEQLEEYLSRCREKAFRLKRMSDRLFEYFLVYGKQEEPYQFQTVSCMELIEDLCNAQFYDWQEQGGQIECQIEDVSGNVKVDSGYLQRIVDNTTSNLKKYADISDPLKIRAFARQDMLHILLTNKVREQKNRVESTQIGLKTCRRIMEKHGGEFSWEQAGDEFCITIQFPIAK